MKYYTQSVQDAATLGFNVPLTQPYTPEEYWMLDRVIADMERGNREHALVTDGATTEEISVWLKVAEGQQ